MTIVTTRKLIRATATVLVATAAVGSLSLAGGIAGAAAPATHANAHAKTHVRKHKHHPFSIASFKCSHAERTLVHIQDAQAHIAAGLPKLTHREKVATQKGKTVRANRIEKRITRRESPTFKTFLTTAASGIEGKCHVPAPPVTTLPAHPRTISPPHPGTTQA